MGMTAHDALAAIREAMARHGVDDVPEGWLTTEQWAAEWALSTCHASHLLRSGESAGVMEMRKFRIQCGDSVRNVQHYRAKQ